MAPFKSYSELSETARRWAESGSPGRGRTGPFRHDTLSLPLVFREAGKPDLEIAYSGEAPGVVSAGPGVQREPVDDFEPQGIRQGDGLSWRVVLALAFGALAVAVMLYWGM